jgi:hypothetical protein
MQEFWDGVQKHLYKGDPEDEHTRFYLCAACLAMQMNITLEAAMSHIATNRPSQQKRLQQNAEYNEAVKTKLQEFDGLTRRGAHKLAREHVFLVIEPMMVFVARKEMVLARRSELLGEHSRPAEALALTTSRREAESLMERMEALYDEIDRTMVPNAFQERVAKELPRTSEESEAARTRRQWEYMLAAQYGDLWSEVLDKNGKRIGAFMTFFVCLAGHSWAPCGTVMDSKSWDRFHANPLVPKQRWYCNCCKARYMTRFGVLVETMLPPTPGHPHGSWVYLRATVPSGDEEDIKAMRIEEELDPSSPQDLYDRSPLTMPWLDGGILRAVDKSELAEGRDAFLHATFKLLDPIAFKAVAQMPWKQIYSFVGEERLMKLAAAA